MIKRIKKVIIRIFAEILLIFIELYRRLKPIPLQIYFCYNQSTHQIYHSIFIAIELSNIQTKYPVVILSTASRASEIIEEELNTIPNNVIFRKIKHPGYDKVGFNVNWFVFLCRLYIYRPKAIVVTDYYDNIFRQLLVKTFWIYTFHGPENRGFTDSHIKDYDLINVCGPAELERLQDRVGPLNNYIIAGYSKFDYLHYHKLTKPKLFDDNKKVIIYNPHFDPRMSSFFDKGIELIETLSASNNYNIIFMPHPDLARSHPKLIDKVRGLNRVAVIDKGKINLDYMNQADLYITDVSSAAFEWLYFDRPAVFFNTKKIDYKKENIYPVWACAKVVGDIPSIVAAIDAGLNNPQEFAQERKEMFADTFLNRDKKVSKTIAQNIFNKIEEERPQFFFPWDISQKHGLNRLILPLAKDLNKKQNIRLVCRGANPSDFANLQSILTRLDTIPLKRLLSLTPLRWSPKNFILAEYNLFDYFASRKIQALSPVYAVQGMAHNIFKKAKGLGLKTILIVTTLHIDLVWQLHKEEEEILGYDYEWLNLRLKNKILSEYRLADTIIVPSKLTYQTFIDRGFDESKLQYLPQRCDQEYFRRRQAKKDNVFRILYVGRFSPQKGLHYLIQGFSELNLSNSELLLFGSTATRPARNWLKKLIEGHDNIKVECGDPRSAYEQASVLVHPSLNDNTGATIYEALAYGLPAIVTENTGAKEVIREGQNGFIIPIRDVAAIKEKLNYYAGQKI